MPFAFFYPLVWVGAIAVGVPVWLHLRRRLEKNVVHFSALRFLEDQPVPQRSPLRLRDILLFLLRLFAVLLLVGAFAWPYLRSEVLTESRVYLIDNSLSHQANDGFSRARGRLLDDIQKAGLQTQVAVLELTGSTRLVSGFGDDRGTAARRVRDLEPSHQRGSYIDALRQADMLLANTLTPRGRLFIYTDHQKNQWEEILESPSFLEEVDVTLSEAGEASAPNLALARPEVQRMFVGTKTFADFAVELHHQGDAPTAVWTLVVNGREILSRPVSLGGQPRSITLTAQWETDPSEGLAGEVRVAGVPDALAGDDRVFFSLPPMREGNVVALSRSPYLQTALLPDVMRGYWATRFLEPPDVAGELQSGNLADVLLVESPFLHFGPVRNLLQRYLDNDRGVILFVTYSSPMIRGFMDKLGFEVQEEKTPGADASAFRYVFTDHPVFRPFRSPDFGNLMEIQVKRYRRLTSAQALPVIFSQSGDVLLYHAAPPKGQLFVCPFALDRSETNWPVHPTFIPFLDLCLQNARRKAADRTTFEPGEAVVWQLPSEVEAEPSDGAAEEENGSTEKPAEFPAVRWTLSDDSGEISGGESKNGRVEFTAPDIPGLYTLTYDHVSSEPMVLSVNPPPLESDLTYLTSAEPMKTWFAGMETDGTGGRKPVPAEAGVGLPQSQILQQPVWWILLLVGLAFLLIETVWVAARKGLT